MMLLKRLNLASKTFLMTLKGGGENMATIYVTLIVRGYRTYSQVPEVLKPQVKEQLEILELGELVAE
ncbi:hypothetical protein FZD47_02540 [Bacillus infantis]|uniref:CD1375-like domain-containing protein n=1 Tax=Bacillus infantis TaxID=324767 RepID=A0A5D4SWK5_9BACI|nr:CD1375 family protein [Bacillus infantis]TYS66384.1 hypothetical protein FZD47_02540 [Bacillus infantis]